MKKPIFVIILLITAQGLIADESFAFEGMWSFSYNYESSPRRDGIFQEYILIQKVEDRLIIVSLDFFEPTTNFIAIGRRVGDRILLFEDNDGNPEYSIRGVKDNWGERIIFSIYLPSDSADIEYFRADQTDIENISELMNNRIN
jgi:hypothetical protein